MARAQAYPIRPVRIIVGFAAGGSNDILARLIGSWLTERLGQPFIVEARPGAGGNIATEVVVNAPPDGHTLLLATVANTIGATVYDNLKFNFIRDIKPVASLIRVPNALEVNPSFPVHTVPELIAYAKANPNRISMTVAANGTSQHISAELFKMMTGVEMVHVFYRGSAPALIDLIGGQTQVMFDNLASSIEHAPVSRKLSDEYRKTYPRLEHFSPWPSFPVTAPRQPRPVTKADQPLNTSGDGEK